MAWEKCRLAVRVLVGVSANQFSLYRVRTVTQVEMVILATKRYKIIMIILNRVLSLHQQIKPITK
jgi:hypothetical protein